MDKIRVYARGMDKKTRQGLAWLEANNLDFMLLDINEDEFTLEDYYNVLALTDSGTSDLVAKRSKDFDSLKRVVDVEAMTLSEFYHFILDHTEIINQPIILKGNKLSLGYKEEDISVFLPRHARGLSMNLEEYSKLRDSDRWDIEEDLDDLDDYLYDDEY